MLKYGYDNFRPRGAKSFDTRRRAKPKFLSHRLKGTAGNGDAFRV